MKIILSTFGLIFLILQTSVHSTLAKKSPFPNGVDCRLRKNYILPECKYYNSDSDASSESSSSETESSDTIKYFTSDGSNAMATTKFGDVIGIDNGDVKVFYGIPYGAVPVGDLRWKAPVDPENWSTPLNCTEARVAIQFSTNRNTGITTIIGTEDALNLDVYTITGAKNLPVLVYVHGGNNQSSNSKEIQGNEIVVRDECVYVSINYRLGLLGFINLPSIVSKKQTGNFSLLDIAKALDWIKENIAAFGGDPNNITISGFSAGGRDVMSLLISPYFKGKFNKAIAFSGGMTTADPELSQKKVAKFIAPQVVKDGKAENEEQAIEWLLSTGSDVKQYLYSLESTTLADLIHDAAIRMSSFPHLFADDILIPKKSFNTKKYNSVPLLMTTSATEFSLFNNFDGSYYAPSYMQYSEEVRTAGNSFGEKYGSDMYRIFNTQDSANRMYKKYKAPIYIGQIEFGSKNSQTFVPMFGSFHGIFVPMLSDVHGYVGMFNDTQAGYKDMGMKFNSYLKNFLYSGNPNGDDLKEWPAWEPSKKLTQVFDANAETSTVETKNVYKTYDDIMNEMDSDTTVPDEVKSYVISNSMRGRWFSAALDERYQNANFWN